jgi:hypothetical protein
VEIGKNNMRQYLSAPGVNFNIPVYQRNYDWDRENCKRLLDDVRALAAACAAGEETRTHFLGTICSKSMPGNQKTIIDGQQRITTLSLLLRACLDFATDDALKRDIEGCLRNTGYGVEPGREVKLHLNRRDDAVYAKLLATHAPLDAGVLSAGQRASSIWCNYSDFRDDLKGMACDGIGALFKALDAIVVVDLDVGDENPQEIFESLNSTGLDLTDVDLLRNYLLMALPYEAQKRLYDQYWYPIEERVHSEDPENMVRFFIDYLIYVKKSDAIVLHGRRRHINKRNLYTAFKQHFHALFGEDCRGAALESSVEDLLSDMLERADSYRRLVFAGKHDMNKMPDEERTIYSIVVLNKGVAARPVLLWILEQRRAGRLDDAGVLELLQAVLSFVFRARVCGNNGMNGQTAGNVLLRLDSAGMVDGSDATGGMGANAGENGETNICENGGAHAGEGESGEVNAGCDGNRTDGLRERFWRAITGGEGKFAFPGDEAFKDALCNRAIFDVLRADGVKYLLYELERRTPAAKGLPRFDDANTTIEHVMPKTLSTWWRNYLEEDAELHGEFLNKLGNLALTSHNSEMSNGSFDEKKTWYRESSFSLTREIGNEAREWSAEAIKERGRKLAALCKETWVFPECYQKAESGEAKRKKRGRFHFSMVGMAFGDEVAFSEDPSKTALVCDDTHVEFDGEVYTLSRLAADLLGKESTDSVRGPAYFTYGGKRLTDLRAEAESGVL